MPVLVDDMEILHLYAETVMQRVQHHADNVGAVALALLGAIIWRGEPGSIRVRPYGTKLGNVLHVTVNNIEYTFRYEHSPQSIEMRRNGLNGPIVHTFSNASNPLMVQTVFAAL